MKGVTIIAEHVVKNGGDGAWLAVALFAGFGVLLLSVMFGLFLKECRNSYVDPYDWVVVLIVPLAILCFGFMCAGAAKNFSDDSTHMEYTVKLDESASYLEFTERYEVLKEEDGVYRVRERE